MDVKCIKYHKMTFDLLHTDNGLCKRIKIFLITLDSIILLDYVKMYINKSKCISLWRQFVHLSVQLVFILLLSQLLRSKSQLPETYIHWKH